MPDEGRFIIYLGGQPLCGQLLLLCLYYITLLNQLQAKLHILPGLFHEGFQTTSFIMNLLSVGSESGHPAAFTAFFLFSCPHLKKCAKHPLYLIYTFFQILYTYFISIKTLNSAEDIFLSQKKVIAEIIHGFCHDLRTVTIQYGYPQDVIGKLPDQRQIVL